MLGTQQPRPNAVGSCFSKYNSSSPSRPLLHRPPQQQFPRFPSRLSSPAGSTRSASPKIASLTVLSHSGSRTGCGVMEDSPAAIILPPPMMESVVTAVGSKSWIPPLSIHCSIKSETSSNSSFSTINAQDEEDHEDTAAFRSTGVASRPVRASCEDSPNRSVSGMLDRTPLPTIALTPRSHASRKDHLPQFPSPNSDDEFTSPFFETPQSATLLSTTCTNSREVNMDSFDFGPKPALLSPQRLFAVEHPAGGDMADGDKSTSVPSMSHEFGPSRAAPTCSLMKPSTSHNSMLGLFEDAARRLPDSFDDTGSLSASDDEDDFLLVPPSVTTGACLGDNHPAKHRRFVHLSSTEEFGKSLSSFPSLNSRHESSNSLYGAGLLNSASANSLSGMDYDTLRAAGSNSCRFARREESSSSLERINDGDRDLVTPPLMQQATSPPPLSHRSGEISARCS